MIRITKKKKLTGSIKLNPKIKMNADLALTATDKTVPGHTQMEGE